MNYPLSTSDIISKVNTQLATGTRTTILALASQLDSDNNLGFGSGINQKTGLPA